MEIKIKLSGSLRCIYREMSEEILVHIHGPTHLDALLTKMGINPMVVANVLVDGNAQGKDFVIENEVHEIILLGPIAGG